MIKVEIIATGNELLKGETVNTSTPLIVEEMRGLGYEIVRLCTTRDELDELRSAIRDALTRADLVFVTGGLGPTPDDLTREALAEAVNQPLEFQPDLWEEIQRYFHSKGRKIPSANINQAYLPFNAKAVSNLMGTAPGIIVSHNSQTIIALPGPPGELEPMLTAIVLPYLVREYPPVNSSKQRTFRVCGLGETQILERISAVLEETRGLPIKFSYLPKGGEVHLCLQVEAGSMSAATDIFMPLAARITRLLGEDLYGIDEETLPGKVGVLLRNSHQTLATAESCTGGRIADYLTAVPGSSDYFQGGIVAYQDDIKVKLLGVKQQTLESYNAVSEETAAEMAVGARRILESDYGLATTGFAGPTGGLPDRPVGTVFVGLASSDSVTVRRLYFPGWGRDTIKQVATKQALDLLRRQLLQLKAIEQGD